MCEVASQGLSRAALALAAGSDQSRTKERDKKGRERVGKIERERVESGNICDTLHHVAQKNRGLTSGRFGLFIAA